MSKLLLPGWMLGKQSLTESNRDLIHQYLRHQSDDAFTELVRRHLRLVFGVCQRVLANQHDAEDAVQATFIVLARQAASIRKPESLASWLHGVAYRTALEQRTMLKRQLTKMRNSLDYKQQTTDSKDESDQELSAILDEEISRLPEHYRLPLVLVEMQGLSRLHASRALGIPAGTISSRLAMAKRKLALSLRRRGVTVTVMALAEFLTQQLSGQVPEALANVTSQSILQVGLVQGKSQVQLLATAVIKGLLVSKLQRMMALLVMATVLSVGFSAWVLAADDMPISRNQGSEQVRSNHLPQPIPAKTEGVLSGTVVDTNGKPLAGALVYLENIKGEKGITAKTDALGVFRYGPIKAGIYPNQFMYIEAPGFVRHYVPEPTVYPNRTNELGRIALSLGKRFRGRVLDQEGKPLAHADLEIRNYMYLLGLIGIKDLGPKYNVQTDDKGYYQTPPLSDGMLSVEMKLPDHMHTIGISGCDVSGTTGETLPTYQMVKPEKEVLHVFKVIDADCKPIAGATLIGDKTRDEHNIQGVTDSEGKFTLRGYGSHPRGYGRVYKDGYASAFWDFETSHEPLLMVKASTIEGKVTDAQTGENVTIQKLVLVPPSKSLDDGYAYRRWSESEMVELDHFVQKDDGTFRFVYYSKPAHYQVHVIASGYRNGVINVGEVSPSKNVTNLALKMGKLPLVKQQLHGNVNRNAEPLKLGWVALCRISEKRKAVDSYMRRGRTIPPSLDVIQQVPVENGKYSLEVPTADSNWYLLVYEHGQSPAQVGPFAIKETKKKQLNVSCLEGGMIQGRVTNQKLGLNGKLMVIAFNHHGYSSESMISTEGTFLLKDLPAGEYGLKIGHNNYRDQEVERQNPFSSEPCFFGNWRRNAEEEKRFQQWMKAESDDWQRPSEPWKRAKRVNVVAGQIVGGIELELPEK